MNHGGGSRNLVVLSGAGLSAESGVATFRGQGGLWEGHRIEDVATPQAFQRTPDLVHRFYNLRRAALASVRPNPAHEALVRLEQEWTGGFLHVTQNVDDLNERAGARKLVHMHGRLLEIRCTRCGGIWSWDRDADLRTPCPGCRQAGGLRPNIVWFGEMPMHLDTIMTALAGVDLFLCVGTSGVVDPAAGFARTAAENGCRRLIEVNLEPTGISSDFTERRHGPASVEIPRLVAELLACR